LGIKSYSEAALQGFRGLRRRQRHCLRFCVRRKMKWRELVDQIHHAAIEIEPIKKGSFNANDSVSKKSPAAHERNYFTLALQVHQCRSYTFTYTMSNRKYLEQVLKIAVRKYGENARSSQGIRRQLREIEQRLLGERTPKILQFQGGFRKEPKRKE
jgi:hypothetical protein